MLHQVEETHASTPITRPRISRSFWQGRITGFIHNFYLNGKDDISFSVSVTFGDDELKFMKDMLKELHASLAQPGHNKVLTLEGKIKYVDEDSADMMLEKAVFNNRHTVFEVDKDGKRSFFPKNPKVSAEKKLSFFDELMNLLADSFRVLPSHRYLTSEKVGQETGAYPIPENFKRWMFGQSLSRAGYKMYEEIRDMFAKDPFSMGEIGFSQEGDEIDIMVKNASVRLPIGRLGSGHQQMLYIIASLVLNRGRMLGIEELEINLSPTMQKIVFEKLKSHIHDSDLMTQVIITSHSNYFEKRGDVRCYGIEHNGQHTVIEKWTAGMGRRFFRPSKKGPAAR